MAKQLGFYFDSDKCTGCKACQVACKDKNDLPVGVTWRRVIHYGGGNWEKHGKVYFPKNIFGYYLSVSCNHCKQALCVEVCPTGAMHKAEDGTVQIDAEKCVGCRYCEWACPYSAPKFNEKLGVMTKCDFCEDLIADGHQPACVSSCMMRALDFGEIDELRKKYGGTAEIEPLPSYGVTQPSLVINPNRNAQKTGTGTGRVLNLPEEI
jgi:anaerobic dimethyl sulfoxide reductase subunit B